MIKKDGTPRGFAFVRFKDPIAADNAVAAQHNLDGRRLDVKAAVSRDSAPSNLSRYSYSAMGVKDNNIHKMKVVREKLLPNTTHLYYLQI